MLCQKRNIGAQIGVREKTHKKKSAKRCRCREGARQRQLATEFRTPNCAERTLSWGALYVHASGESYDRSFPNSLVTHS
jgi:hypothetical protein